MNLKTKITLGFVAMLLLLAGVGAYSLYSIQRLSHSATGVLREICTPWSWASRCSGRWTR